MSDKQVENISSPCPKCFGNRWVHKYDGPSISCPECNPRGEDCSIARLCNSAEQLHGVLNGTIGLNEVWPNVAYCDGHSIGSNIDLTPVLKDVTHARGIWKNLNLIRQLTTLPATMIEFVRDDS